MPDTRVEVVRFNKKKPLLDMEPHPVSSSLNINVIGLRVKATQPFRTFCLTKHNCPLPHMSHVAFVLCQRDPADAYVRALI